MNYGDDSEMLSMGCEVIPHLKSDQVSPLVDLAFTTNRRSGPADSARGASAAAIGQIYELCRDRILSLALRITGNPQDAEDAVQDCFVQAFLHLDSFAGRASLSTWIWRIAINAALMKIRKRRRLEFSLDEHTESRPTGRPIEIEANDPTPDQQLLRRELQRALAEGLATLSTTLSKVVELHYFAELSVRECAHVLGISPSSAKARIFRAKLRLRPAFTRRFRRQVLTSSIPCFPKYALQSTGHDTARRARTAGRPR